MMYRNTNPLCPSGTFGYWNDLNNDGTCNNEAFFGLDNFGFICEWENPEITEYILILGNNLKKATLSDTLSPYNSADTDKDGLLDWHEVKSEYATVDEVGNAHFPKRVDFAKLGYAILGWEQLEESLPGLEEYLNLIEIVPCNSDPTKADSDGDGTDDNYDPRSLSVYNNGTELNNLDSNQIDFIQHCLVSLGYLNMLDNPYGESIGILTTTAINLYQLNHGLETTDIIDNITYLTIANDYFNHFEFSNRENFYFNKTPIKVDKEFFDYIPITPLYLPDSYEAIDVSIAPACRKTPVSYNGHGVKSYHFQ